MEFFSEMAGNLSARGMPWALYSGNVDSLLPHFSTEGVCGPHAGTSVGEVRSQTDWNPVWTGPDPAVPVPVWDFPKNTGPLGLQSGQFHIA